MGRKLFAAIIASIAAASAVAPTSVAAGTFVTGNDLLRYCQDPLVEAKSICLGYVMGAVDYLEKQRADSHVRECIPKGVEARQVIDVVVKFLNSAPAVRQDPASELVGVAVITAWDCGHP